MHDKIWFAKVTGNKKYEDKKPLYFDEIITRYSIQCSIIFPLINPQIITAITFRLFRIHKTILLFIISYCSENIFEKEIITTIISLTESFTYIDINKVITSFHYNYNNSYQITNWSVNTFVLEVEICYRKNKEVE